MLVAVLTLLPVAIPAEAASDRPVPGGWFYAQDVSHLGGGFILSDEGGVPFWTVFNRLGGVETLGYPISRRFALNGLISQATQRAILQWDGRNQRVNLVNILDQLNEAGLDSRLEACCSTPPANLPAQFDAGKSPSEVAHARLSLLDDRPNLRAAYFATPNYLDLYGLPASRVTDMGNHFAVRTQRTVIQEWKEDVPWAKAGQVTFANAGTIAAEVGLIPLWAMLPEESPGAGGPDLAPIDELDAASVDAVTAQVRRATVRVLAPPAGTGTGFIIDKRGYIVTANHVVEGATAYAAVLADGSVVSARLVGRDPVVDVAVLGIPGGELPVAPLGSLASLREGDPLIALGYGPPNTNQLSIRLGRAVSLASRAVGQGNGARLTFLLSTVPLVPGYSGGPIVDAQGRVVGMDSAVIVARGSPAAREGISIAIETALKVAQDLIATQPAARALPLMSTNESPDVAAAQPCAGVLQQAFQPNPHARRRADSIPPAFPIGEKRLALLA